MQVNCSVPRRVFPSLVEFQSSQSMGPKLWHRKFLLMLRFLSPEDWCAAISSELKHPLLEGDSWGLITKHNFQGLGKTSNSQISRSSWNEWDSQNPFPKDLSVPTLGRGDSVLSSWLQILPEASRMQHSQVLTHGGVRCVFFSFGGLELSMLL